VSGIRVGVGRVAVACGWEGEEVGDDISGLVVVRWYRPLRLCDLGGAQDGNT